jgi:hypothetical protein
MNKTTFFFFFFEGVALHKNKKWGVAIRKKLKTTGVHVCRETVNRVIIPFQIIISVRIYFSLRTRDRPYVRIYIYIYIYGTTKSEIRSYSHCGRRCIYINLHTQRCLRYTQTYVSAPRRPAPPYKR